MFIEQPSGTESAIGGCRLEKYWGMASAGARLRRTCGRTLRREGVAVRGSEERMVRELNDRLYALLRDLRAPDGDFDCECGEAACRRSVALTLQEYATLRVQAGRAVLSPEHADRRPSETGPRERGNEFARP
jgi:hypothetical protein